MSKNELSQVADEMIDLCRSRKLNPEQVANVITAIAASFVKQSGFCEETMIAMLRARLELVD